MGVSAEFKQASSLGSFNSSFKYIFSFCFLFLYTLLLVGFSNYGILLYLIASNFLLVLRVPRKSTLLREI